MSDDITVDALAEEVEELMLRRARGFIANEGCTPDALKIALAVYKECKPRDRGAGGGSPRIGANDPGLPFGTPGPVAEPA